MENKASKTRSLKIAFVVDADHLRRLAVVLGEVGDSLDYTVKFSDGSSVHYTDMKDIIGLPNSTRRAITSLIAGSARDQQSAYVTLKMTSEPYVEYTLSGAQRDVTYWGDQLDDWTATIKQWYSWFLEGIGAGVFMIAAFAFPPFLATHLPEFFPVLSRSWVPYIFFALVVAEVLLFRLFPKGTFAIGDGAKRYKFLTSVRTVLLVGYLVSFLGSVSANLLKWHP